MVESALNIQFKFSKISFCILNTYQCGLPAQLGEFVYVVTYNIYIRRFPMVIQDELALGKRFRGKNTKSCNQRFKDHPT